MAENRADAGGFELFYRVLGENQGLPAVILEAGYGISSKTWSRVQEEIAAYTQVLVYDRAGLGQSGRGNQPRHGRQHVENLRDLLSAVQIEPPYILVGHSYGGLIVRLFASMYPENAAGVVLVDPTHEDQEETMIPLLQPKSRDEYYQQFSREGTHQEFVESLEQVRSLRRSLGDIPLTVITAGQLEYHTEASYENWLAMHKDLLRLSTNSTHVIARHSGHNIHRQQPEIVIEAIKNILLQIERS